MLGTFLFTESYNLGIKQGQRNHTLQALSDSDWDWGKGELGTSPMDQNNSVSHYYIFLIFLFCKRENQGSEKVCEKSISETWDLNLKQRDGHYES